MTTKTIHVFWTGGWDSTYRILELSTKNVTIQPYYLKDNRKSEELELSTIHNLTKEIRSLKSTQCTILELITKNVSDIDQDSEVTQAYENVYQAFEEDSDGQKLGSQYEWLARFSKNIENLELGIEKGSKVIDAINTYGGLEKIVDDSKGAYFILNKSISSKDLLIVFGNYHYPLLEISKLKMKEEAEKKGFIHLLNKTWFCHDPFEDKPCGVCNPCMQTIEFGLEYRFDKKALKRHKAKNNNRPIKKSLLSRFARKIKSIYR